MNTPAQIKKIGMAEELAREVLVKAGLICLQDHFHLVRNAGELLHQSPSCFLAQLAAQLAQIGGQEKQRGQLRRERDRKSTRLNSSHGYISYAVFCLKK